MTDNNKNANQNQSPVLSMVYEMAVELHKAQAITQDRRDEYEALCLPGLMEEVAQEVNRSGKRPKKR
jgi:hypothetical protein